MSTKQSTLFDIDNTTSQPLADYLTELDPKLLNRGWGLKPAKRVEYGGDTDQSMANHVRNGVFAICRLNDAVGSFDGYQLSETALREVVALFVMHDLHKLRESDSSRTEYDIDAAEVEELVSDLDLRRFAPTLEIEDFHACAVDHEDSWKSNPERRTRTYDDHRPFVRLADAFASCATPEAAASTRNESGLAEAYPGEGFELRHHTLDDVKGVFTNLLNGVVSKEIKQRDDYELLLIYQDGCVYLADDDADPVAIDESFIESVYKGLQSEVNDAHPAYDDRELLAENLTTRSQGFYGINDQDFFYAGAANILTAVAVKATQDADPESDPTDSMRETMKELNERLPIDIDSSDRVAPGYARFVYTLKRAYVDPLVEAGITEDALVTTAEILDADTDLIEGLKELRESDMSLTAGGKWDYSYALGQHIANLNRTQGWQSVPVGLSELAIYGLRDIDEEWEQTVMAAHTGELETEIRAYIADILRIGGQASDPTEEMNALSDPFEEHHNKRRGKTCTLCNRGTTSTRKSDMTASKSLTTFQAGYSNRIPADAGKPDKLLVCTPCKVEFSLRETGSTRREAGRLFVHLMPDYFYTPEMWSLYVDQVFSKFTGEAKTRLGRLAEAVFELVSITEASEGGGAAFAEVLSEATTLEGGRPIIETLDQEFKENAGFGAQTLSFYKIQDNETEFQFFGVFLGLAIAAATGLRVYITQSPLPDLRARDFPEAARLDAGFSSITEFYGRDIPLSELGERLGAAAALIQLGYALNRDDARFAGYLQLTRNKPLPGSHLLKRIAQAPDDGDAARYLLEEADYLDQHAQGATNTAVNTNTD